MEEKNKIDMRASRKFLFRIFALLALLLAVYHFVGIFYPINSSPYWRHLIFVFVNLFCSYGLIARPRFFNYFFFLLMLQQFYSHGGSLLNQWSARKSVDWVSLFVLIFLIVIFVNLILETKTDS
jgi:hypothetical protein